MDEKNPKLNTTGGKNYRMEDKMIRANKIWPSVPTTIISITNLQGKPNLNINVWRGFLCWRGFLWNTFSMYLYDIVTSPWSYKKGKMLIILEFKVINKRAVGIKICIRTCIHLGFREIYWCIVSILFKAIRGRYSVEHILVYLGICFALWRLLLWVLLPWFVLWFDTWLYYVRFH